MMRNIYKALVIIALIFYYNNISAQKDKLNKELYQNVEEPTIYKYYTGNLLVMFWVYKENPTKVVEIDTLYFGFYDTCGLPSLDSLKQNGTYYFEVDSSDFSDEEMMKVNMQNNCAQLNVFTESKDTLINIYYSNRQQFATYKKVDALPKNVQEYLQKKGIKMDAF